ncbi:MAG: DMT family transporter [Alphaproteobacteria bacterium]|nr:DMT family transporter [Alphaproteobacteria bacterium]
MAVFAGMLMVVQSACNGMLETVTDRPVEVGVISLGIGISTLIAVGILFGQLGFPTSGKLMEAPLVGLARPGLRRDCSAFSANRRTTARSGDICRPLCYLLDCAFGHLRPLRPAWVFAASRWNWPVARLYIDGNRHRACLSFLTQANHARNAAHSMPV